MREPWRQLFLLLSQVVKRSSVQAWRKIRVQGSIQVSAVKDQLGALPAHPLHAFELGPDHLRREVVP